MKTCILVSSRLCSEPSGYFGLDFQYSDGAFAAVVMVGHALMVEECEKIVLAQYDTVLQCLELLSIVAHVLIKEPVDAILNGDGMTPGAFPKGDFLALSIIGTHPDETTETITYYLADYRSENEADHYYVKDWQWVDLSALGVVESITFRMESSRNNDWGMTTPGYFCMDDFNGKYNGTPSGIENISCPRTPQQGAATEIARYTLDGRRIHAPQRGIYIIRMSDGSTRKVVVK